MAGAFVTIALALSTPGIEASATAADTCGLLRSAYHMSVGQGRDADLANVVSAKREPSSLADFTPEYRRSTGLTSDEFADLQRNQAGAALARFLPNCSWSRGASSTSGNSGFAIAFGAPILSSDHRIALVEVSSSKGISASGDLCVMRRSPAGWTGRCIRAWTIR